MAIKPLLAFFNTAVHFCVGLPLAGPLFRGPKPHGTTSAVRVLRKWKNWGHNTIFPTLSRVVAERSYCVATLPTFPRQGPQGQWHFVFSPMQLEALVGLVGSRSGGQLDLPVEEPSLAHVALVASVVMRKACGVTGYRQPLITGLRGVSASRAAYGRW